MSTSQNLPSAGCLEIFTKYMESLSLKLNLSELANDSPEFKQVLTHAELTISEIRAYYEVTQSTCKQTIKNGTLFATSLLDLVNCISFGPVFQHFECSEDFNSDENIKVADINKCTHVMQAINRLKQFSRHTDDFMNKLEDIQEVLLKALNNLDNLLEIRTNFLQAYEKLENAICRAGSISSMKPESEITYLDSSVKFAKEIYHSLAISYLCQLHSALGSGYFSTYFRLILVILKNHSTFSENISSIDEEIDKENRLPSSSTLIDHFEAITNGVESHRTDLNAYDLVKSKNDTPPRFQGYLFKRSGTRGWHSWVRLWFRVSNDQLIYCKRFNGLKKSELQNASGIISTVLKHYILQGDSFGKREIEPILNHNFMKSFLSNFFLQSTPKYTVFLPDSKCCTVRKLFLKTNNIQNEKNHHKNLTTDRRFTFELVSDGNTIHYLQAENKEEYDSWYNTFQSGLRDLYVENIKLQETFIDKKTDSSSITKSNNASFRKLSNRSNKNIYFINKQRNIVQPDIDNTFWKNSGGDILLQKSCLPHNRYCVDCHSGNTEWASINLGVTLCTQCTAVHRSLGVHISKTRSLTLDNFQPEQLHVMINLGNLLVNQIYEKNWNQFAHKYPRINAVSSYESRHRWINLKWVECLFARYPLNDLAVNQSKESFDWIRKLFKDWMTIREKFIGTRHDLTGNNSTASSSSVQKEKNSEMILNGLIELLARIQDQFCENGLEFTPECDREEILSSCYQNQAAEALLTFGARLGCPLLMALGSVGGAKLDMLTPIISQNQQLSNETAHEPVNEYSPLILAARTGSLAACEYLLLNGAEVSELSVFHDFFLSTFIPKSFFPVCVCKDFGYYSHCSTKWFGTCRNNITHFTVSPKNQDYYGYYKNIKVRRVRRK